MVTRAGTHFHPPYYPDFAAIECDTTLNNLLAEIEMQEQVESNRNAIDRIRIEEGDKPSKFYAKATDNFPDWLYTFEKWALQKNLNDAQKMQNLPAFLRDTADFVYTQVQMTLRVLIALTQH